MHQPDVDEESSNPVMSSDRQGAQGESSGESDRHLTNMVFQMVILINDSLVLEIGLTVVGGTVDYVSNACLLEGFLVFGNVVASKVEVIFNYLGHHAVPN